MKHGENWLFQTTRNSGPKSLWKQNYESKLPPENMWKASKFLKIHRNFTQICPKPLKSWKLIIKCQDFAIYPIDPVVLSWNKTAVFSIFRPKFPGNRSKTYTRHPYGPEPTEILKFQIDMFVRSTKTDPFKNRFFKPSIGPMLKFTHEFQVFGSFSKFFVDLSVCCHKNSMNKPYR